MHQLLDCHMNILLDADGMRCDFMWSVNILRIDAGVHRIWVFRCVSPEGIFDDYRGILSDTQFQKQNVQMLVSADEVFISAACRVPTCILYKCIVTTKIHCHRLAADWTIWHKLTRHAHVLLLMNHLKDDAFIVIGFLMTRYTALKQSIIALCVE